MNESQLNLFPRFKFLNFSDVITILKQASFKSYNKGELIVKPGEIFNYIFFVRKGILRTYVVTKNGVEKTTKFTTEGEIGSVYANLLPQNKQSTEYLEALEDCKVVTININDLEKKSHKDSKISRFLYEALKQAMLEAVIRIEFFVTLTPEERYKKMIEASPDLIQRIPQKYLASYIGITDVSISRIKNRIVTK
jgi:CRP-like cAMP-binding protein